MKVCDKCGRTTSRQIMREGHMAWCNHCGLLWWALPGMFTEKIEVWVRQNA
jgi:uncharacterized Zn finger protein